LELGGAYNVADLKKARNSLWKLLDFEFRILCFAHGTPVRQKPKEKLRSYLESEEIWQRLQEGKETISLTEEQWTGIRNRWKLSGLVRESNVQSLYQHPLYYEIAFSFRDIDKEVDVLEACAQSYAQILVKRFLEIGCGNSPHMEELFKRGYEYTGIDLSTEMLEFSQKKLKKVDSIQRCYVKTWSAFD